jgi:hypothetical protein
VSIRLIYALGFVFGAILTGCALGSPTPQPSPLPSVTSLPTSVPTAGPGLVSHVVIIIQENRSVDNMFNGFPGASTVTTDPYTHTPLQQISMGGVQGGIGASHAHKAFLQECNAPTLGAPCAMNGFPNVKPNCPPGQGPLCTVYGYAPMSETAPYFAAAEQGTFGDMVFQANEGPSYPGHQYLTAAQGGGRNSDGTVNQSAPWTWGENGGDSNTEGGKHGTYCGSKPGTVVTQVNLLTGDEAHSAFPCSTYETVEDNVAAAGLTWRYYTDSIGGFWSGTNGVKQDYNSPNFIVPETQFFTDFPKTFANLTVICPGGAWSDHPHKGHVAWAGSDWVNNITNAIEASQYANNTVIMVTWDDWGGWYDHVAPPFYDYNSNGFRVPFYMIGPGVIPHNVDHQQTNSAAATIGTAEWLLGVPSLNQLDSVAPTFANDFDFVTHSRASWVPVPTQSPPAWYQGQGKKKNNSVISDEEADG